MLEHKATGIEQLRKYSGETEIEDIASEASNAADMKAAASGNPLILEETKLRTEVKRLTALQRAHSDGKYAMQNTLNYKRRIADTYLPEKVALIDSLIAAAEKHPLPKDKDAMPLTFVEGKKVSNKGQAEELIGLLSVKVRESVDSKYSKEIEYRGIKFTFERGDFSGSLNLESPFGQIAYYGKDDKVSPSGVLTRFNNQIDSLGSRKKEVLSRSIRLKKT